MGDHVIFFGWNRSVPGRERMSAEHFQEFAEYLGDKQREGTIDSFDPVFLTVHGGDLNGFFLIRGEADKLNNLQATEDWLAHIVRANHHLDRAGLVRGVTGSTLMSQMELWTSLIPSS